MEKRGQVTIFIIAAIVIVAIVVLFFVLKDSVIPGVTSGDDEANPNRFIDSCIEESLRDGMKIISSQGGYIVPELSKDIDGQNVSYLCYNVNFYLPCVNQEPVLIRHLDQELENYVENEVRNCFTSLSDNLRDQGYEVTSNYRNFDLLLGRGRVILDVDGDLSASRKDDSINIDKIRIQIQSNFYDNAIIAQEIVSQEAEYCNFEQIGFGLLYPQYSVDKFRFGDGDTRYTIESKQTGEEFRFLVRSCVIPPGF